MRGGFLFFENGRQQHAQGRWISDTHFVAPWGDYDTWLAIFTKEGAWTTTLPLPFESGEQLLCESVLSANPRCFEAFVDPEEAARKVTCPSVHVWWECPGDEEPSGFAVDFEAIHSADATYFMAVGFHCGYIGIQDRDPKWVLFSVWHGREAPTELVGRTGEGVIVRPFGGEGEGLQSFRPYEWSVGRRYRCIVTAEDAGGGATDFIGYIQDVASGSTERLATLRRHDPKVRPGKLRGLYSFLEDWHGSGAKREGRWGPAFARTSPGCWTQVMIARGTTNDEQAPNVRVWLPVPCEGGGRLAMRSGGDAVADPGFRGPFLLPESELPEELKAF